MKGARRGEITYTGSERRGITRRKEKKEGERERGKR